MAYLRPSSATITEALEVLRRSPGGFQRLAEHYVLIQFPGEFDPLIPLGRNTVDATRGGWPDAFARSPRAASRLSLLEVTAKQTNWRQHVRDDLAAAAEIGGDALHRLTVVLWRPSLPPGEYERLLEDTASRVGLPPEKCRLVFRERLVEDLREPRFARLWSDRSLLGLPISTTLPFFPLEAASIFGDEGKRGSFAPSVAEYEEGRVEVGPALERVEASLAEHGYALVRGHAGAGKTVLATEAGLKRNARRDAYLDPQAPTYYLRLGRFKSEADRARALDVFAEVVDDQLLTIVDDVHLDEEFAAVLHGTWRETSHRGQLLLVGRELEARDGEGTRSPLSHLKADPVVVRSEPGDVGRVLRRLRRREGDADEEEDSSYDAWWRSFGGDLGAFAAAVANAVPGGLRSGELPLRDASEHVWRKYLDDLDEGERSDLFRVAALAALEVPAPAAALSRRPLHRSQAEGYVRPLGDGPPQDISYELHHPGVGELILAAVDDPTGARAALVESARADAGAGALIASRLRRAGKHEAEAEVLAAIVSAEGSVAAAFLGWPHGPHQFVDVLRASEAVGEEALVSLVQASAAEVVEGLGTTPGGLCVYLESVENLDPAAHESALRALREAPPWDVMLRRSRAAIKKVMRLTTYLRDRDPAAYRRLCAAVAASERPWIALGISRLPLVLERLTVAADAPGGDPRLALELATPAVSAELIDMCVGRPTTLPVLLSALAGPAPEAHRQVLAGLRERERLQAIADSLSHHRLSTLASIPQLADLLPGLDERIADRLATDPDALALRVAREPMSLPLVLRFLDERRPRAAEVLAEALEDPGLAAMLALNYTRRYHRDTLEVRKLAEARLPAVHRQILSAKAGRPTPQLVAAQALEGGFRTTRIDDMRIAAGSAASREGLLRGLMRQWSCGWLQESFGNANPLFALQALDIIEDLDPEFAATVSRSVDRRYRSLYVKKLGRATPKDQVVFLGTAGRHFPLTRELAVQRWEVAPIASHATDETSISEAVREAVDTHIVEAAPSPTSRSA